MKNINGVLLKFGLKLKHRCRLSAVWSLLRVVFHQDGPSSGCSLITMVPHQSDLSSGWSLIRVLSHQGAVLRVVSHHAALSSGQSVIRMVSHSDDPSSGCSHQGALSSGCSFIRSILVRGSTVFIQCCLLCVRSSHRSPSDSQCRDVQHRRPWR